jgi:hypothetical protein
MIDFRMGEVLSLMTRTAPFLVFRFLVFFGITLAYILGTCAGAGMGWLMGSAGDAREAGLFWGALTGFGVVGGITYFLREYLLYMVKAGHIAVLVEYMDGKEVPGGKGQITYATGVVKERFVASNLLFALDQIIKGILNTFNRTMMMVTAFIPIPALQNVVKIFMAIIRMSLTYLDEVILAYIIRTRSTNSWASARDALVLYAQNYKTILKNAVFLTFIIWGLTLLIFVVLFATVGLVIAMIPGLAGFWTLVLTFLMAISIKAAVIDPIAMTALMQVFFKVTEGQQPDPEWSARLDKLGGKVKELKDRAAGAFGGGQAEQTPPQASA